MKKIFTVALMAVVAAFTASVAKPDISLSGYQEFYAESVDQSQLAAGLDQAATHARRFKKWSVKRKIH